MIQEIMIMRKKHPPLGPCVPNNVLIAMGSEPDVTRIGGVVAPSLQILGHLGPNALIE